MLSLPDISVVAEYIRDKDYFRHVVSKVHVLRHGERGYQILIPHADATRKLSIIGQVNARCGEKVALNN